MTKDTNDPTEIHDKNIEFELTQTKQTLDELKAKYDALVDAHQKVLVHIDQGNRAILMDKLKKMTSLKDEQMAGMDTVEMQRLVDSYSLLKQPIAGVRPGDYQPQTDSSLYTVPSKFRFGSKE